jgi:superfamily II DNA or RNA helicase/HKD family nuclease
MSRSGDPGSALELDVNFGYLSRTANAPRRAHPQVIVNSDGDSMLRALREELKQSSTFTFSVAFVSPGAIALLKQELVEYSGRGRIVTSDYLGFNSPAAFGELLNLARLGLDVRLHQRSEFHPKGYVFEHGDRITAFVGSSNLTKAALVSTHEWNLRVSAAPASDLTGQFGRLIEQQLAESVPLTPEWVERYAEQYVAPRRSEASTVERAVRRQLEQLPRPDRIEAAQTGPAADPAAQPITPNAMQQEALFAIDAMRREGKRRAVVISATGTGKTILSALDVRAVAPRRMLFVVHREQILDRAIQEFKKVLGAPASEFGKLSGSAKQTDARYLFATIQTLSRPDVLTALASDAFDYILIDEVHRAGAQSYARVLQHFEPTFLLGMTATPERSDGFNVFELFDFNVPYEIRLNKALEADMLVPFHYYGVTDVEFDDGSTVDEQSSLFQLAGAIRVDHIIDAVSTYGHAGVPVRGLMFCSRKEEARALSEALNERSVFGRQLRTTALTGDDSIERREQVVDQLEAGELDYILTVDIFNEGVDIPSVNQIVMLRQTQSAIVFVQQLGRGLRKADGKDYLVVIDFIGNYANNFLIPIALFGDDSLNRESVRQHLISAEEIGVVAGLSSVRFDRIAQERVLRSLADTQLDSLQRLKRAIETLHNRLGRLPSLHDFLRFESADPVVLATRIGSYPLLLERLTKTPSGMTSAELRTLMFLSHEALAAKRVDELLTLRLLIREGSVSRTRLVRELAPFAHAEPERHAESAVRVLSLAFATEMEQKKYQVPAVRILDDGRISLGRELAASYARSPAFRVAVDDLIETGLDLVQARYTVGLPFTAGRLYSRKDAVRLLLWPKNSSSTVYGYKVDRDTATCPIFNTMHKSEEITASTAYEDELLDRSTMRYYSKSKRTLQSPDVSAMLSGEIALHVFAKKSDADGSTFYYLGEANAASSDQTSMVDDHGNSLSVVRMLLRFLKPIEPGIFDYFQPSLS